MTTVNDIGTILESLPHRYPFLMVDRVLEIVEDEKIVALKNVSINEPFFQGHFPQTPIMPGVLIVEAMGQAGGILFAAGLPPTEQGRLFYFMGFDKVRFRKPVTAGDQLILELKILKKRRKVIKMAGTAFVERNIVAEAELMATFGE
jgi:beta-hydroxyacyl-ACP dehydratase FabZ